MLPQHSSVAFDFTGRQIVRLGLLAHGARLSDRQKDAIAERTLAETEALAFADRPYTVLSGGERQRVQLARVLAQCDADPAARPFLLLDEPIAGLDLAHQHAALASARRRAERGLGVLAVLHDLTHGCTLCRPGRDHRERPPDRPRTRRNDPRSGPAVAGFRHADPAAAGRCDNGFRQPR